MTDVVFVGPTLPAARALALLPGATICPPIRHGDLLREDYGPGDRVFIIDGYFLQTASVRHREILCLLERGVTVAGSSSMGALRAAELWQFGMRGFGEIFRLYREGVIDGDAEVAITHGAAEDGYRPFSDPLASIRIALRSAASQYAITREDEQAMLDLAAAMPFRDRSFRALDQAARRHLDTRSADSFAAWRSGRDTDAKAADARLMLTAAATGDPRLRPADPDDQPIRNVHVRLFDRWQHRFHGSGTGSTWVSDADAAAAIRLAHPDFAQAHRRHVLAGLTGLDPEHPALAERAVTLARERGLTAPATADPGGWLTGPDLAQPPDEVLLTLLVRAFGAEASHDIWGLPARMRTPEVMSWARQFVLAARACNDRLLRPADHGRRRHFRPAAVDATVARLWQCPAAELSARAWDRGIVDLAALRQAAEPFVAHLKLLGVPAVSSAAG